MKIWIDAQLPIRICVNLLSANLPDALEQLRQGTTIVEIGNAP